MANDLYSQVTLTDLASQSPQLAEMAQLIERRDIIRAIKIFRTVYGVGLKEAKDAVASLMAGESITLPAQPIMVAENNVNASPEIDAQVLQLVRAGKTIQAIKRYRELTNLGLKESKEVIEKIASDNLPPPSPRQSFTLPPISPVEKPGWSIQGFLLLVFVFGVLFAVAIILILK
jgi:ribosomal protein L7/L12